MNILHITSHLGDGAGKAIGGLALLSSNYGNKNRILLLQKPRKKNHIERCRKAGIEVLTEKAVSALQEADIAVFNWWGNQDIENALLRYKHTDCKKLIWMHKNGLYDPPFNENLLHFCDRLLVTSPLSLTKWNQADLVYGFGDFDPYSLPVKMNYARNQNELTIGYIGSPSYKKLPDNVIDYFKETLTAIPEARFVLIGETTQDFKNNIRNAGLEEKVDLKGWIENPQEYLLKFDIFAYLLKPNTYATTENAVLEAMASGLPVVMSREPLGKYILGDSGGILVDTPGEFAEAMRSLSKSQDLRESTGVIGRDYVRKKYSSKVNATHFHRICEEVTGKDRRK